MLRTLFAIVIIGSVMMLDYKPDHQPIQCHTEPVKHTVIDGGIWIEGGTTCTWRGK